MTIAGWRRLELYNCSLYIYNPEPWSLFYEYQDPNSWKEVKCWGMETQSASIKRRLKVRMDKTEARKVICKIHFGLVDVPGFNVVHVESFSWRLLSSMRTAHAILWSNPKASDLLKLFVVKCWSMWSVRIALWDLNLKRPESLRERIMAVFKSLVLKSVDQFLTMHHDTSGYQRYFRVSPERCQYIPFKANNLSFVDAIHAVDGDYIVSCGASHRDFNTLLKAVETLPYRTVVILSDKDAKEHGAKLHAELMSNNVEHIREPVYGIKFNELIAAARIVVVPIIPNTIQPAGISVFLEAMALGKPVIVTKGVSTEGILNDDLAILVPPGDPISMRNAIETLWNDSAERARLGKNGKQFAISLADNRRLTQDISKHFANLCRN